MTSAPGSPPEQSGPGRNADDSHAEAILAWYRHSARVLPWRAPYGQRNDPYRVWLSEIMLQQTTVGAVIPYFQKFTARWPTVGDLAAAPLDDVLTAWAGLGYYARARNLHKCARVVAEERAGQFPETEEALKALPGIGAYTSAAIAAIAFGHRAVVVDGNVERVMARLFAVTEPLPDSKGALKAHADSLTPDAFSGDYAQAVMDLGATICTPRKPACGLCPWVRQCAGRKQGIHETLPAKRPKAEKPTRRGTAFFIERPDGKLLIRRRAEKGLLGGMMEFPSTHWEEASIPEPEIAAEQAPMTAAWTPLPGLVRHTFTHFHLELQVLRGQVSGRGLTGATAPRGQWVAPDDLGDHALPTVMVKVARHALKSLAKANRKG
ncbi:MAG: A/G-specific adenine glycosylase [Rhodospirillaceae bacterium]